MGYVTGGASGGGGGLSESDRSQLSMDARALCLARNGAKAGPATKEGLRASRGSAKEGATPRGVWREIHSEDGKLAVNVRA